MEEVGTVSFKLTSWRYVNLNRGEFVVYYIDQEAEPLFVSFPSFFAQEQKSFHLCYYLL